MDERALKRLDLGYGRGGLLGFGDEAVDSTAWEENSRSTMQRAGKKVVLL